MAYDKPAPLPEPPVAYAWNPEPSDAQWEPLTDWLPVSEFRELDFAALLSGTPVGLRTPPTAAADPEEPEG